MPLVQVDKKQLDQLKSDLKSRQTMYMAEAKACLAYQQGLADIMHEVTSRCKDESLVDDIAAIASGCENQAKAELAAIKK
jgi:hypothetical protein